MHPRRWVEPDVRQSHQPAGAGPTPRGTVGQHRKSEPSGGGVMILLRRELGDVLREQRQAQGRTLREVSASASVSLGYLSEVERGEKEASSELLASLCGALNLPLSQVLVDVSSRMAESEGLAPTVALPVPSGDVVSASAA